MPEDRVIDEIKKAINDREKTDRRMSFGGYFLILLSLSIISLIIAVFYPGFLLLGLIPAIIFGIYIWYSLIKREEHFKREQRLLSNLILRFEGKIDESRISYLRNELRYREDEEEEKNPIVWSVLMFIPFLGLYIYYFLMADFYRHDKREAHMLRYMHDAMESMGTVFLIPNKPQSQEIPNRNFMLYVVLTILTAGIFGVYWLYLLFKDPNIHFEYQKDWENRLLEAIQTPIIITPPPISQLGDTIVEPPLNAQLVLPNREIEITQNENVFGRSDFERDLSEEDLSYITSKQSGRYHFMIIKKDGIFYIKDDLSRNGTKLNDTEIKGAGKKELKNGDKITLAGISNFIMIFKTSVA